MLKIKIFTDHASFRDEYSGEESRTAEGQELCRCLRNVIKRIEDGWTYGRIYDSNREKVGYWRREDDEEVDREAEAEDREEPESLHGEVWECPD